MSDTVLLSSPESQKKFRGSVSEIVASLLRIDAERDNIKAIVEVVKEDLEVPTKLTKKVAAMVHKQNKNVLDSEAEDADALYDIATK